MMEKHMHLRLTSFHIVQSIYHPIQGLKEVIIIDVFHRVKHTNNTIPLYCKHEHTNQCTTNNAQHVNIHNTTCKEQSYAQVISVVCN